MIVNFFPMSVVATIVLAVFAVLGMISYWWLAVPFLASNFLVIIWALTFGMRLTFNLFGRVIVLSKGR
jgi:hypothetical protein